MIERAMKTMRATYDYVFTTTSKGEDKLPIPSPLSLKNYLKHFVDFNGDITTADMTKMKKLLTESEFAE